MRDDDLLDTPEEEDEAGTEEDIPDMGLDAEGNPIGGSVKDDEMDGMTEEEPI